jgi:uncharacterized damage-inducible protein DinB
MKSYTLCFLAVAAVALSYSGVATSQEKAATPTAVAASGPRDEFLGETSYYEQRYTQLADAIPADKYAWRPGEGVRSVGEVYTHIVAANYGVARAYGAKLPAGLDFKSITEMSTDKTKTIQALKESFAFLKQTVRALNDADADKPQKMFGRETTLRGSFLLVTGHFGEHLGQSIAYARINGIVPPWTAEQQRQQKQAQKPNL